MTSPQADFALQVALRLREAGHASLWAGGCVRDQLLGKAPKDYDVATDAPPERVREVFGKRHTVAVGASFGVITVLGAALQRRDAAPIEVATFRSDGAYTDGRRPDAVTYSSPEEDARRRDFTINGLFYDPVAGTVIDYVGGQEDLAKGVVRAIGVADDRFAEDRLRMLRGVRFAATLGFTLDNATVDAIRRHAGAISAVSPERIGAELRRMLVDRSRRRSLELLAEVGLLDAVLPPLAGASDADLSAIGARIEKLDGPTAALALAALVVDRGDGASGARLVRDLKWTAKESDRVRWLVEQRGALVGCDAALWSAVQPLLAHEGGGELLALHEALGALGDGDAALCRERLAWPRERLDPPPLVTGGDLLALGLTAGPRFSELLAGARAAQLDGLAATKDAAIAAVGLEPDGR